MQKVKILEDYSPDRLSEKVERFINSNTVIDIKYSTSQGLFNVYPYTAMVIYESNS